MSNAMRFGKRSLAGVAAGALALGMLTIASAPAASAKPSIKPKAVVSTSTTPIRVSYTGTTLDSVGYAALSWTTATAIAATDTVVVKLTAAPSPLSQIGIGPSTLVATGTTYSSSRFTNATDTVMLSPTSGATIAVGAGLVGNDPEVASIAIAANEPGTYAGTIEYTSRANNRVDTGTFAFTTSGKPTSMSLTPAVSSTSVSGKTNLTVQLKDTAGNLTQPLAVDSVTITPGATSATGSTNPNSLTGTSNLWDGEQVVEYTAPGTAGSYTVTATPGGTLPSGGVTAQTATVNVSGTISTGALTGASLTVPANAVAGGTAPGSITAAVPGGTSAVTVAVTGGTANSTVRLAFFRSTNQTGTIDGTAVGTAIADAVFKDVTLNASGNGSTSVVIGGNLLIGTAPGNPQTGQGQVIVQQAKADNTREGSLQLTINQQLPTVTTSTIRTAPSGSIVQALGTATPVVVTVTDQFRNPIANAQVQARRGTATLLTEGITNASGQATLNVSGATGIAAGTTETYNFYATPAGSAQVGPAATPLTVLYTTSGAVTSMSVNVVSGGAGVTTPILNSTTAIPTMPWAFVPYGGFVTTNSTGVFTPAAPTTGAAAGNYVTFQAVPNPANTVTVTVPDGVKVSTTQPSGTNTLWSAGSQSVTAASSQNVYVWATKTGTHDITFKSGAITTTAKIRVSTEAAAAYNIAVSPTARTIEAGAFSTATLTVSDVFGNAIPAINGTAAGNAGAVTASASGEVLLSGLNSSATLGTGADGTTTVTLIAGKAGTGKVTFTPSNGVLNAAAAWGANYTKPVGAPDPVKSAELNIVITTDADKSITISGTRGTVSGKSGIIVDGVTEGIENGKTVTPFIRFPGETTFTAGSARPAISGDEFTWQRKTGKRVTVYVELSDDASVRSNRVTIQAN